MRTQGYIDLINERIRPFGFACHALSTAMSLLCVIHTFLLCLPCDYVRGNRLQERRLSAQSYFQVPQFAMLGLSPVSTTKLCNYKQEGEEEGDICISEYQILPTTPSHRKERKKKKNTHTVKLKRSLRNPSRFDSQLLLLRTNDHKLLGSQKNRRPLLTSGKMSPAVGTKKRNQIHI